MRYAAVLTALAAALAPPAAAQVSPPAPPTGTGALRVFLDCTRCDFDFLRQEITFINYVRDRKDAEVHVLVTTLGTGSGGLEYTLEYIGLERFAGVEASLRYVSSGTDTSDERRRGFAQVFQLGLMRYVAETPLASQITIGRRGQAAGPSAAAPGEDPWNFWIFRLSTNGDYRSEARTSRKAFRTSFSANRTTEAWKISLNSNISYSESRFDLGEGEIFVNVTRNYEHRGLVVKSLGDHWSAAARGSVSRSTFFNQALALSTSAGLEYDIFPYAESTRRAFTIRYQVGVERNRYEEMTIFNKLKETLAGHSLEASLSLRQPWGTSGLSFEFVQFLHDLSKQRAELDWNFDVRLFRGFSFDIDGNVSRVRDQLYLPAGDRSAEEILLLRRQLATTHRYSVGFGISYQFGSIYNNVVNPRFGGR